jgi:hypothetical protein
MAIPTDKDVVEISTDEDWREPFEFFVDDEEQPDNFTGSAIVGGLVQKTKAGEARLDLDLTNLTIGINTVIISVDRLVLRALPEGLYNFALSIIRPGGDDEILIRGKRKLTHGVRP